MRLIWSVACSTNGTFGCQLSLVNLVCNSCLKTWLSAVPLASSWFPVTGSKIAEWKSYSSGPCWKHCELRLVSLSYLEGWFEVCSAVVLSLKWCLLLFTLTQWFLWLHWNGSEFWMLLGTFNHRFFLKLILKEATLCGSIQPPTNSWCSLTGVVAW